MRIIYGFIVGVLFSLQFHFGPVYATPELALVVGNLFSYFVSPKNKLLLRFKTKRQLSAHIYEFSFDPNQKLDFKPGQYLEWTLPEVPYDIRGNRRYFTIASSPTEPEIKLGIRIDPIESSNFKKKLFNLKKDHLLVASQLSGEFTLPNDQNRKLVFIAGGIGITPFRSMLKYLADTNQRRDIVLFYACATPADFAFKEEFESLKEKIGLKIVYLSTEQDASWKGRTGYITLEMLNEETPDFSQRSIYLSGPNDMVENYKRLFIRGGVGRSKIYTDYFPGF